MKIYIAKDLNIKLQIKKIVKLLNSKCKFIQFEELPLNFHPDDELIKYPATHKKYLNENKLNLKKDEFVVLATETQYDNNYFYEEKDGFIIMSFFGWQYLTSQSKESGLVYLICGILIDEIVPYNAVDHTQRLGCVNDFLSDKTRVDDGIKKGHLCNGCKKYINDHKLSETQVQLYEDIKILLRLLSASSGSGGIPITNDSSAQIIIQEKIKSLPHLKKAIVTSKQDGVLIFISYSHKDEKDKNRLETHLAILKRLGIINAWTDRKIDAGDEWKKEIDKNLNECKIILLLISGNFIASDYCYDIEMTTALSRHDQQDAIAIPIILRDCLWQMSPFAKLQVLPTDGKPIQNYTRKDEAYTSIVRTIARIIQENYI